MSQVTVAVAAVLGALLGLGAERLAARWPRHADGGIRAPGWRTLAVPLAGAVAFGALAARWSEPRDLAILAVYAAVLIVLLATDLEQRLLPDVLTLPLIPFALVVVLLGLDPLLAGKDLPLVSSVGAGVGAPLLLLLTDRLFSGALGLGDVKLAIGLGLFCGVTRLFVGFMLASIGGAVVILVLLALGRLSLRSAIPFGPILIAAGIIAALL